MNNPLILMLIKVPGIVLGLTFHEFAHGLVAHLFGDKTPKKEGRLTLNPLVHIDIIGLLMLFFMNFGWAKPIHTNPSNFKNRKIAMILVSIAGPLANIFVAIVLTAVLKLLFFYNIERTQFYWVYEIINYGIVINIILGIFNLIPLPPLDGSKIIFNLIPPRTYFKIIRYEYILQISLIVLLFIGIIPKLINPLINYCVNFLFLLFQL